MCSNKTGDYENVRVVIRVRPFNKKEIAQQEEKIVTVDHLEGLIMLKKSKNTDKPKCFKFDHIFAEESTQKEIYRYVAFPIVEKSLRGYNGTIMAYGQTGTGKTYTMAGLQRNKDSQCQGIIPNTFNHIFSQIASAHQEKSFVVTVTYLEIYNEDVRDLLAHDPNKKLEVRERLDLGVYVKNLMGFTVDSIKSITKLMERGNSNRITRSTLMNDVSSRSHAIFTITIESKDKTDNTTTIGKLNLVDLAGSERLSRTQATGDRLKEAGSINQSLSVLGNVISALVDGKSTHIPYRNSKLTRLLQDSLGGNSKTIMIAMISPSASDYEESLCTLRYASRVKYIRNETRKNVETKKGLIEKFEEKIAKLKEKISQMSLKEVGNSSPKLKKKDKRRLSKITSEELLKCNEELLRAEEEKEEIVQKIATIQRKILIGGENLLEKAQEQEFLLEMSGCELESLDRSNIELEENLYRRGSERILVEEKYCSLQEENDILNKKIDETEALLSQAREELLEKKQEYHKEIETLNENYRQLMKDFKFVSKIIEDYVPKSYIRRLEDKVIWNDEIADYQILRVAHAGNNIQEEKPEAKQLLRRPTKQPYYSYSSQKSKRRLSNSRK